MNPPLISQGAEAKIYLVTPSSAKQVGSEQFVEKQRIPKSYRHPQLDNLIRTRRTKSEGKILFKALNAGAQVPKVLNANQKGIPNDKFILEIEFLEGDRLSETLNDYDEKKQFQTMKQIGEQVAILHANNIIHGDLTTSNVILKSPSQSTSEAVYQRSGLPAKRSTSEAVSSVYIIDFGLGFISTKLEDKAVDLHLIKQALEAKHFRSPDHLLGQNHEDLFKEFKKGYKWKDSKKIIERLEIVEKRGRYKH